MNKTRFIIQDLKGILDEIKKTSHTANSLYRNRILYRSIVLQRDLGDIIVHAEYESRNGIPEGLTIQSLQDMLELETTYSPFGLKVRGISKDFSRITWIHRSVKSLLDNGIFRDEPLREIRDIEDISTIPIVNRIHRGRLQLALGIDDVWCFLMNNPNESKKKDKSK